MINFRKDRQKALIDYIEQEKEKGRGTSEIFAECVEQKIESDKGE